MQNSALAQIVLGSKYLYTRALFADMTAEELDALQDVIYAQAFNRIDNGGQFRTDLTAAGTFRRIAEALADDKALWSQQLNNAKAFVTAFVMDGLLTYTPSKPTRDPAKSLPAFYSVNPDAVSRSIVTLLKSEPCVQFSKGLQKDSTHYAGALAMSAHAFSINGERFRIAAQHLKADEYLTRAGTWKKAEGKKELAKLEQQRGQIRAAHAVAWHTKGEPFHFEVKADGRGRLYYVAGMLSPQAGGVADYVLGFDEEVSFDSTASFAQFIAVLTSDKSLGEACNLLNHTGTPKDFYAEVFHQATGNTRPSKDSLERKTAKAFVMPKAYGAGNEACKARAFELAEEEGIKDFATIEEICAALEKYQALDAVKHAGANLAMKEAKEGRQIEWITPAGFHAKQNYWMRESHAWKTGAADGSGIPAQITFSVDTEVVKIEKDDSDLHSSANVAAAANIVQSLDASFLAECLAEYRQQTGKTLKACHDSVTFRSREEVQVFKAIAWEVFKRQARCTIMQQLRQQLGFTVSMCRWLPDTAPAFMAEE